LRALAAGIEAVHPQRVLEDAFELDGSRLSIGNDDYDIHGMDIVVLGGGNAAGHAAAALESVLGDRIRDGLVVTDDPTETERIEVVEGTHPLPSARNVAATRRLRERAETCTESDLVIAVVGGGASALLCAPHSDVSLDEYRATTRTLLESGARIDEINAVRKHLSTVKGGRLARALAPARTAGIVFSDVAGNAVSTIASGPTAPDGSTY